MSLPSSYDFLIVGAGFAGATFARLAAEAGKRVLIVDRRDHIGGNAYDYVNEAGVRVQKYGVHAFHTNSDAIWAFLSRFTEWHPYEHRVKASVRGQLVPFPVNAETLRLLGLPTPLPKRDAFPENAEEQCLATVGRDLYDIFYRDYTQKQWGRSARELDPSVTARIQVRFNGDDRVFTDKRQAIPKDGYTAMFERMLDHPLIELRLGEGPPESTTARIVWTGAIDERFAYCFGRLPYRSLRFEHTTYAGGLRQPCAQINYPSAWQPFTRTIEWRHVTGQTCDATTITTEFPSAEGERYYPVPCPEAQALYKRYEALALREPNVTFIGRLATYQYLNMDQVVGQAMAAFRRLNLTNPARV